MPDKLVYVMTITCVTLIYGTGLPLLYPIAALSLIWYYYLETTMLHYVARMPPQYDNSLNQRVYGAMFIVAPSMLLAFSYWMLSNKQLLTNDDLNPIQKRGDTFSQHLFYSGIIVENNLPANLLLLQLTVFIFYNLIRGNMAKINSYLCPSIHIKKTKVIEHSDLYQNCLSTKEREWVLKEEALMRTFGIYAKPDCHMEKLEQGSSK